MNRNIIRIQPHQYQHAMTSKTLMQSTMFNDLLSARAVMHVPVDAGDDGVVVTVSAKVTRTDARTDVVIVLLAGVLIGGLVGGMVGVDMLAELGIVIVGAAVIALEVFVTVSWVVDV